MKADWRCRLEMNILIVIDQFDDANNGTTISAQRFAETLKRHGNEVRILSIHASDVEIEAISCMEAICSGLVPVISNSPNSATPQFALDERSLFECGSSNSLAGKIDYWYEHGEERMDMEQEYSGYGKRCNIDSCVNQIEKMFMEAISEAPRQYQRRQLVLDGYHNK
jgi:hypothetical protein